MDRLPNERLLKAAKELGQNATATEIANHAGFKHSPKHFTKYQIWNEFSYCQPRLTTPQRESIIKGEMELCEM